MSQITAAALRQSGLSRSFADHVTAGTRQISVPLALWLYEQDGIKAGPLSGKSPAEIKMLRRLYAPSAPRSVLVRRAARAVAAPAEAA